MKVIFLLCLSEANAAPSIDFYVNEQIKLAIIKLNETYLFVSFK